MKLELAAQLHEYSRY